MDRFHSVYSVRGDTTKRIYSVRVETDKKASNIQARSFMARALNEIGKKSRNGQIKKQSSIMLEDYVDPEDKEFQENHQECSKEIGNTNGSRYAFQDMQEEQEWRDQ